MTCCLTLKKNSFVPCLIWLSLSRWLLDYKNYFLGIQAIRKIKNKHLEIKSNFLDYKAKDLNKQTLETIVSSRLLLF